MGLGNAYNGLVQDNIAFIKQWNWQNFANYDFSLQGGHNISLMAGMEYQYRKYQDVYAGAFDFVSSNFQNILDGTYTDHSTGGTMNARGFRSFFGRVNYNWNNRYLLEASFRADSYSGFGKSHQTGYFPGVSAAWRIKEEAFMSDIEVMNDLKLRGSWGIVGNGNVEPYASRTLYAGGQYANLNGLSMSQVGNDNLKWERVEKN